MSYSYSAKRVFRAVSKNLLKAYMEQKAPDLPEIDWNRVGSRNVEALYVPYLALDDTQQGVIESELYEIFTFASVATNAQILHNLMNQQRITPPDGFDEWSLYDKSMWLRLNSESAWTQSARFAHIDRIAPSLWFEQQLYNGGAGKVEYEKERFERLQTTISNYIFANEGRGKYGHVEYFERTAQNKECFFVYLSDYPRNVMKWNGGNDFQEGVNKTSYELVFVYDRDSNRLSLRTTGLKEHKVRLCRIWADVMRDTIIDDADLEKPAFRIDGFKKGASFLTISPLSDVREAKVVQLEVEINGSRGSRRVFEESDRDLFEQMNTELNPQTCPMSIMEVIGVKIRFVLNPDKYGRRKKQTLYIRPDHCDLNSKDPSVQVALAEALKEWAICA